MSRRIIGLCLAIAMMLCAANVFAEPEGVTVTDMYGREVTLTEPATRIVALTASDCEILCALGCEDALVGRGEYCDYPPSVLDKPSVQSGYETNIEQILALEPQLVLMSDMAQSEDQVNQLEANGVKVAVSNAQTIDEVYVSIDIIAANAYKINYISGFAGLKPRLCFFMRRCFLREPDIMASRVRFLSRGPCR